MCKETDPVQTLDSVGNISHGVFPCDMPPQNIIAEVYFVVNIQYVL